MTQADLNQAEIQSIRFLLKTGEISYDEAKKRAEPIIKEMNKRIAEISKEYGMRGRNVSFIGLMR